MSSKETAGLRYFFKDWLRFDDSEEQDDAEWEQDKQREADDVNEEEGEEDERYDEGSEGTTYARISEEVKDESIIFDLFPTPEDDVTKGQINNSLQIFRSSFNKTIK